MMTRKQFAALIREMVDELETDHEEQTGMSDDEMMTFEDWLGQLTALYENTRA